MGIQANNGNDGNDSMVLSYSANSNGNGYSYRFDAGYRAKGGTHGSNPGSSSAAGGSRLGVYQFNGQTGNPHAGFVFGRAGPSVVSGTARDSYE